MVDELARIDASRLDQQFLGMLLGFLGACRAHGLTLVATMGYRDRGLQAILYEKYLHGGPRAAKPGTSLHEKGLAVDFLAYRHGVKLDSSDEPEYILMEEIAPRYELKTLRSIGDGGHVEWAGGK